MSSNPSASIEAIHAVTSIASGDSVGANAYQQWLEQQEEEQQLDSQSATSSAASNPSAFSTSSLPGAYKSSIGNDPIEKDFDFTPQQAHQFVENVMNTITSQIKQDGSDMAQAIQKIGSDDPNSGIFN